MTRGPVPLDPALVLEATGDVVVAVDGGWRVTYANGRARALLPPGTEPVGALPGEV